MEQNIQDGIHRIPGDLFINRNALITSIMQGKLCHKGKVWQDGLQVSIRRGRP